VRSETYRQPIVILPRFQHYGWGDSEFIPLLFGLTPGNVPYAEAWLGAHKIAPSPARLSGEEHSLDQLIASRPEGFLGHACQSGFGELPYLVKVLSAAQPLSIQVHPSKSEAIAGYRRESAAMIPLNSARRNYRDSNSKPEILIALTPFWALAGFRPAAEIATAIKGIRSLARLLPPFDGKPDWLERLVAAYFGLSESVLVPALTEWVEMLADSSDTFGQHTWELWALRCHRLFQRDGRPDRGVFFVPLLNLIRLERWHALFLDAGTPHAYLLGSGIEVMSNSDNVLRGGLTPKHVDVDEFLKVLKCKTESPFTIPGNAAASFTYPTPAEEFEVERLTLNSGTQVSGKAEGPVLLMFLGTAAESQLTVASGAHMLEISSAGSCFLPHDTDYTVSASGPGDLIRVAVPKPGKRGFRGKTPTQLRFGTSGLRGLVSDITDLEAYINVRGYLDYLIESGEAEPRGQVVIAGDLRPSTDSSDRSIMAVVARACHDGGFCVVNAGKIPTPALSYYAFQQRLPSIMVTGSHIPFDRNGIKFNKPSGELLKADEAPVLKAVERVRRAEYFRARESSPFGDSGMFQEGRHDELPPIADAARNAYVQRYLDFFPEQALRGIRVVVYQHSAVGRDILVEILSKLGAEVHAMARTETFVPIDTEAISAADVARLTDLATLASRQFGRVDAIVSTDGDSDRPLIVAVEPNRSIRFVPGDLIGILVAEYLKADAIAVPVSATDAIELRFREMPVQIVRTRIGSPFVIAAMNEMTAQRMVAFEANGGFLVGSVIDRGGRTLQPLPTRDAVLPILALLHAAREKSMSLAQLTASLPQRHGKSGLLDAVPFEKMCALMNRFAPGDADAAKELERFFSRAAGFGSIADIDFTDGFRIRFENGDIAHVRGSGNAPQLRIYAFADTQERAENIVERCIVEPGGILRTLLASVDPNASTAMDGKWRQDR
jgi:phosphomannomutase